MNHIEVLRDQSHHRDYNLGEWFAFFAAADLRVGHWEVGILEKKMDFGGWVRRSGTDKGEVEKLRQILEEAGPAEGFALGLERDAEGNMALTIPMGLFLADKQWTR